MTSLLKFLVFIDCPRLSLYYILKPSVCYLVGLARESAVSDGRRERGGRGGGVGLAQVRWRCRVGLARWGGEAGVDLEEYHYTGYG